MAGDDRLLPPEICTEILIRLPAKSILLCRSVCKSWYSLVSCPSFISYYYSTRNLINKNIDRRVLLRIFDYSNVWTYSYHNESFTESPEHDYILEQFREKDLDIVGSCNGLICLCQNVRSYYIGESVITFFIWNPTIRKVVELPSRTFRPPTQCASYFGFGFDSNTNDYKVLMSFDEHMCEVFDLRKGVWRVISPKRSITVLSNMAGIYDWSPTNQECYLNGAVHWSGFKSSNSLTRILLSFDVSEECFRVIRLPDCADFIRNDDDDSSYIGTQSMTIGGLIYVIAYQTCYGDEIDVSWSCSLWAMKEYGVTESWTKVSNIDLQSFLGGSIDIFRTRGFHLWENGEVLFMCDVIGSNLDFVLYNIESRKFKCIFSATNSFKYLCWYEESLVLM